MEGPSEPLGATYFQMWLTSKQIASRKPADGTGPGRQNDGHAALCSGACDLPKGPVRARRFQQLKTVSRKRERNLERARKTSIETVSHRRCDIYIYICVNK